MNYKPFILNVLILIILYHVIFEVLIVFVYHLDDLYTPIGRIFRSYFSNKKLFTEHKRAEGYVICFNLVILFFLCFITNKWFGKESFVLTFLKIIAMYIAINMFIVLILFIGGIGLSTIPAYILYFLIPMTIMVLLILPIFWLSNKLMNNSFLKR